MLRSATTRSSRLLLLLLQRSHVALLSQKASAVAGCSSSYLKANASTFSTDASSHPAYQGGAAAHDGGRVGRTAQAVVSQQQAASVSSARGGLAIHRKGGSSSCSLLGLLARPSGYLLPSLASARAYSQRSLSADAEQPVESPVAEEREQDVSLAKVAVGQASAPAKSSRLWQRMPYIEGLPQAWPQQVPSKCAPSVRPDDGTIASAQRNYIRELRRRKTLRNGDFSAEQYALADAAVQKSRSIYNSRRSDPRHAEEEAQRRAKMNALAKQRRVLARKGSAPTRKAVVIDEDGGLDRRLYPLYRSLPPDDHSMAAARAHKRRAEYNLERARKAQLDDEQLATFERAFQVAADVHAERYSDPRNAEEVEIIRSKGRRKNTRMREKLRAQKRAVRAQMRASQGLAAVESVDVGLVTAWADLAADQGKTLAPVGTDDGSVAAAYRMFLRADNARRRSRNAAAHSDQLSKLKDVKKEMRALYKARLNDPANAQEREIYEAYINRNKHQRKAQSSPLAKKAASKPDSALGQA